MTAPAAELQKAIFVALGGDQALTVLLGGSKIYDHAPTSVAFPYITFGRTSIYDWSTGTESGTEQLFTLHVWSKAKGKKETLDVMEAARACLDGGSLALDEHHLVNMRLEFAEARYDEDLSVHHGLLRYRAVTEEAA
ncbi:DUF3168 domain-containing protein [Mesorhizobium sp. CGMCC 1.15528]|uniref:DUF3168 domain-containing protein n=1 Tax=Mesorhizobium zhangyense TaxID=1776730 RepID=A0A7C9VBP6_9HYPH|nr:DUF3168 domain-containing protein [Mesorhizobium zhangyense]NGN40608.1 DUF3168 domain-containing protein [Mesorhizobium zhangyense]